MADTATTGSPNEDLPELTVAVFLGRWLAHVRGRVRAVPVGGIPLFMRDVRRVQVFIPRVA
jgi:hypothetical protein